MPRTPRDDAPGVAHHIMLRGIERRLIFLDDADRREWLRRLELLAARLGFRCFAFVLMPNHTHLVVQSARASISRLMARLATGYAVYFNRRYERVGHLFQNRFRSRRVIDDADLLGLVLYVCRNPLEGGIVRTSAALEHFPWCGLGGLLGQRPPYAFEAPSETLRLFGADPARARRNLREWMECPEPSTAPSAPPAERGHAAELRIQATVSLEQLLEGVCVDFGVTASALRSRQRRAPLVAARAEFARRATRHGICGAGVARCLGMTRAAVSLMLLREADREPNLTT
jgi:REP element-mobilizing transposase RayT